MLCYNKKDLTITQILLKEIFMTNFSKKIFLTAILATTSLSFAKLSEDAISDCFSTQLDGAAKYLEYHFIFQPNNKLQALQTNLAVSIGASAAAALLTLKAVSTSTSQENSKTTPDNASLIASGMICGAVGYIYYSWAESNIKAEILVNFLKNWAHHRQFLPEDFVTAFDELAAYQADGKTFSTAQINEIFELVLHFIEHSFEKRYPKEKKSPDLLGQLKTITEIGKNCAPGK